MTAAAAAAKTSLTLVGEPSAGSQVALVLALAVGGGLVEGLALGVAQAAGLSRWLPRRRRIGWVLVTLAVAGSGWAVVSAPTAFAGDGGTEPPLLLVLAGAVGIGQLLEPGDPGYEHALASYQLRWPRVVHLEDTKVVRIRLLGR